MTWKGAVCPDMRGRIVVPADNVGGAQAFRIKNILTNAMGSVGGVQQHQLAVGELPGITSAVTVNVNVSGTSTRGGVALGTFNYPLGTQGSVFVGPSTFGPLGCTGTGTGTGTAQSNNTNGQAHNNVQPSIVAYYIIRIL